MAVESKCAKCGGTGFELGELDVRGCPSKLYVVRCSTCGGVVGLQEYVNMGSQLAEQNDALNKIAKAVNASDVNLNT